MQNSLFINECRIPLESINKLIAIKYPSKSLSSKHKKYIERAIEDEFQKIAIFEGDILFCLLDQNASKDYQIAEIKTLLKKQIREFHEHLLQPVTLLQLPASTVERLVFALISAQAKLHGIYRLRGRMFFQPSQEKQGHSAVEVTLVSEGDWIKLYFVPTLIVLKEITKSRRLESQDTTAIGLCNFRKECAVSNENGRCRFFTPGFMGFVADNRKVSQLSVEAKERFQDYFNDCPQIQDTKRVVSIKATKNAKNTLMYPAYTINLHFADEDFTDKQKFSFRNSTLMPSEKRWGATNRWVNKIWLYMCFKELEVNINQ